MSLLGTTRNWMSAAAVTIAAASGSSALAQHGHWDVTPGHFHRHGNHWDFHPRTFQWHRDRYPQPAVPYQPVYPGYQHPSYSPPATAYDPPSATYPSHPGDGHGHASPPTYVFGAYSHVDELAATLETQANAICWTLHQYYQRNPGFRQTYREAYEMLTTAKYLHGLEHHQGNRDRIRQVAQDLDDQFHHIEQDVAAWTEDRDFHGVRGQGRLAVQLRQTEDTLHHLMTDIGMKGRLSEQPTGPPPVGGPPPAPLDGTFDARP